MKKHVYKDIYVNWDNRVKQVCDLYLKLIEERGINMEVLIGRVYRHFKGDLYLVEGIAIDSETDKKMVVYRALYGDFALYVRPYDMFIEKTDKNKYPLARQEYRFQLVEIESQANKFSGK